jgi:hypothetical protein
MVEEGAGAITRVIDLLVMIRRIPAMSRYYMALVVLEVCGELKLTEPEGTEDQLFDLLGEAPERLKKFSLTTRRVFDDVEDDVSSRDMKRYVNAMMRGIARPKTVEECAMVVGDVLALIASGDVEVIGWDLNGLLEFRVTALGAQAAGIADGDVFLSMIGDPPQYGLAPGKRP